MEKKKKYTWLASAYDQTGISNCPAAIMPVQYYMIKPNVQKTDFEIVIDRLMIRRSRQNGRESLQNKDNYINHVF